MCCLKYFCYQLKIFLDALYRKYKTGSFAPPALSLGGEGSLGLGPLSLGGKVGFGAGGYPGEGDTRSAISSPCYGNIFTISGRYYESPVADEDTVAGLEAGLGLGEATLSAGAGLQAKLQGGYSGLKSAVTAPVRFIR